MGKQRAHGWFDTEHAVASTTSPLLVVVYLASFVPGFYAISHGADWQSALGLLFLQASALLLTPRLVFTDGGIAALEQRWLERWAPIQLSGIKWWRRAFRRFAQLNLVSPVVTVLLFLWLFLPIAEEDDARAFAYAATYTMLVSIPAILVAGVMSEAALPKRLRGRGPSEHITLATVAGKLHDSQWTPLVAICLFLIGNTLSVFGLIP